MNKLIDNIKNLREITGAGFLDCKKALEENKNDIDSSIDFLRKKGLAKANKKSTREAKEGAVGYFSKDDLSLIMQINTETDFAAKNEVFLDFMEEISEFALKNNDSNLKIEDFNNMIFDDSKISDKFKNIISKIGENIVLNKLLFINKDKETLISHYIHNSYRKNIGKIAVMMKSKVSKVNDEAKLFGKNLCMHIAASKPLAIDINNLDKEMVSKEKELQLETIKSSGKPKEIIEKILEGKMKKFYSESTFYNQQYILDSDKTINEVLKDFSTNNKFEVLKYNLVVLGN